MSPHIHTDPKSRFGDHDKQRLILRAAQASIGQPTPMPVLARGKTIGWVQGQRHSRRTRILECGFPTVNDIYKEMTQNNKARAIMWHKCIANGSLLTPRWHHLWPVVGFPGPGLLTGTAKTFVPHSDSDFGAMFHGGNVSSDTKHLVSAHLRLTALSPSTAEQACFMLYDLVGSYDQCDFVNSSQTLTTGTTPDTDYPGRYVSSGEDGLQIYPVTTGTNGNTGWTNVIYTDNAGNTAQSAVTAGLQSVFTPGTPTARDQWVSAIEYNGSLSALEIPLLAGDSGVRKLESYQMGSTTAGAFSLLLGKPIAWMPTQGGDWTSVWDYVRQIPSLPQIKDKACLVFAVQSISLGGTFTGGLQVAWG